MKIMHICLASAFTMSMGYQDSLLAKYNALGGHEVVVVSDCRTYIDGKCIEVEEEDSVIDYGIHLIRYKYDKIVNKIISDKVRKVGRLYSLVEKEKPDVILFHGPNSWELINVSRYVRNNPGVKLYVDSHGDYHNSAQGVLSKFILHRIFYRNIIRKSEKQVRKFFYLTEEVRDFLEKEYKVSQDLLEFYPLGGEIIDEEYRKEWREKERENWGIKEETLVLFHSGKLDKLKKTRELIEGIRQIKDEEIVLLVAGSIPKEDSELEELLRSDERIKWLGWKNSEEMKMLFCVSDIYVQPGSQSATMQNAVCSGLPVVLYPHKSYLRLCKDNVAWVESSEDIAREIAELAKDRNKLLLLKNNSMKLAKEVFDYKVLANRLCE